MNKIHIFLICSIFNLSYALNFKIYNQLNEPNKIYISVANKDFIIGSFQLKSNNKASLVKANDDKVYYIRFIIENSSGKKQEFITKALYNYNLYFYYIKKDGIYMKVIKDDEPIKMFCIK